jgi:rSAM/selenodomain-associated transferase 1
LSDVLAVFLKRPRAGEVKTRLIPDLGAGAATALYRVMVEETLRRTAPRGYGRRLFFSPPGAGPEIESWLRGERCTAQAGTSLGERMARAFDVTFDGGARRTALIGTDLPWITRERVLAALGALEEHDVVLGPSEDGGYYLVALREPHPELFDGIAWSTPSVYAATLEKARELGLSSFALPEERDIDTLEDVRACWPSLRALLHPDDPSLDAIERRLLS